MVITIDDLLMQEGFFRNQLESLKRDDVNGKALIRTNESYSWPDCNAEFSQILVLYDPSTKYIKAIKIYGFSGLQEVCDYVDEYGHFLWNDIVHYFKDLDSFPETVTLITSYSIGK